MLTSLDPAVINHEKTRPANRVLFLNSPESMGADSHLQALIIRCLDRADFEVHVACSKGSNVVSRSWRELESIPAIHLRPANFGPSVHAQSRLQKVLSTVAFMPAVASMIKLALYIRSNGIQIIHASDRPRDALACAILSRLSGAKSVIHFHVKSSHWQGRAVRWSLSQADALVSISEFVTDSLVETGTDRAKIRTVLNAIDLAQWDCDEDPAAIREEFNLTTKTPTVVSISRLIPWKGQAELIRAIDRVRRHEPAVRLLIVGSDDPSLVADHPYSEDLKALVRELGLEANVVFAGQRSDVRRFLAAADIFALASHEEPFGLVFLEAMAMKKPVVAIANGGTPEVVKLGHTGLLSAAGDIDALAANILALVREPALRKRLGNNGRAEVERRFTAERMSREIEQLYRDLLR